MEINHGCVCVYMDGALYQSPNCHAHPHPASKLPGVKWRASVCSKCGANNGEHGLVNGEPCAAPSP